MGVCLGCQGLHICQRTHQEGGEGLVGESVVCRSRGNHVGWMEEGGLIPVQRHVWAEGGEDTGKDEGRITHDAGVLEEVRGDSHSG